MKRLDHHSDIIQVFLKQIFRCVIQKMNKGNHKNSITKVKRKIKKFGYFLFSDYIHDENGRKTLPIHTWMIYNSVKNDTVRRFYLVNKL